jgi:hypothetical protein
MLKEKNVDETVATLLTTSNELKNKSNTMPKSLPVFGKSPSHICKNPIKLQNILKLKF